MKIRIRPILFSLMLVAGLPGCVRDNHGIYYHDFPADKWNREESVYLFHTQDSLRHGNISLLLRPTKSFYNNALRLVLDTTDPEGNRWTDTITVRSTEWNTEARGLNYKDYFIVYRNAVRFVPGTYRYRLTYHMQESELNGISTIGIRID